MLPIGNPAGLPRPSDPSFRAALVDIPAEHGEAVRLLELWSRIITAPFIGIVWDRTDDLQVSWLDVLDDIVRSSSLREELEARLRLCVARHRRQLRIPPVPGLRVSISQRTITANGLFVRLSLREFQVFVALAQHLGTETTRTQIYREVWGGHRARHDERIVDVYIGYLRRRLHAIGRDEMLRTIRGVGYLLAVPCDPQHQAQAIIRPEQLSKSSARSS